MAPKRTKTILDIRQAIDKLDEQLIMLLNQRAALAIEAGKLKKGDDKPYYTPEREREIVQRLSETSPGPLQIRQLQSIYREIISAARSVEKQLTVSYWGPPGTFSHLAAIKQFGNSVKLNPCDTIEDLFRSVEHGQADYGVAPIENSLAGVVPETLDMFPQTNVKICAEVYVHIAHHLLSRAKSLAKIKTVYAGPQPAAQCRKWLKANLPKARIEEAAPTAAAAKKAAADASSAAIGNALAAELIGLKPLVEHIEDNPNNRTRFLVIGYNEPQPTGQDKTSFMFNLRNRPGQLYRALGAFEKNGVNLMMIESRPAQRASFEYIFYVDCQGHQRDANVKKAAKALKSFSLECVLLGSYPEAHDSAPS